MNRVPLIIYEGDDNSIGKDVYNLNRILSTELIDLLKRDKNGKLKSVVCNTDIVADKYLGLTSILDNKSFEESYKYLLNLNLNLDILINNEILYHLNNIERFLPNKIDLWRKESNIINISGYKSNNEIIICSPEGILKCTINSNIINIRILSLLDENNYLEIKPSYIFLNDNNNNTQDVNILSNTNWSINKA